MSDNNHFDTDVLVVGAGPMGATTALALATYGGVRVQMVNRYNWTANTPRAHINNQRAAEVLRDLGVEQDALREATPWEWMAETPFVTSLTGPEIARLRSWGTGEDRLSDYRSASPCTPFDLPQNRLEPILISHAAARGATLSFNTTYLSHIQDDHGVTVQLRDELGDREYAVHARYLVGADGARSKVMEDAGLALEGQLARAATVYAQFRADLSRHVAHRPGILYWVATSDAAFGEIGMGLLRAIEPWTVWVAGWGVDMAGGEPDRSAAEVTRRIRGLVGDPDLAVEIEHTSVWHVNQAHAPIYAKGRVFCGGDAVHRHPPSNGLGSNTCIQDAFNLAWKLAYVVKGHAGAQLLDSYSLERAPVGAQIVKRANQSRIDFGLLKKCLRDASAPEPVEAGLRQLADPGPNGQARRQALAEALALKNYEYNAHGIEMNQRYASGAVLADGTEEAWRRDRELYAQPSTRPGAKLPHAWLIDRRGRRISTLDLVGKGRFTLVTGLAGAHWVQACRTMALPHLDAVVIGAAGAQDVYCQWHGVREIDEGGALLVRPDAVIAWRARSAAEDESAAQQELNRALSAVMGGDSA